LNLPLDEALSRARLGDRDAFEAIYRHAVGRVYALAQRLEGRDGEAEDLTQEVFLRVWRALPSFRGDAALSTWIHGIAVRTAMDRYRRSYRSGPPTDPAADPEQLVSPATARDLDLEAAIRGLPPGMRQFFVLHAVEGYRLREIAELAGVAIGTVQSQVFEARRKLRERLGGLS
jgi:RNA polymerase sigma-70 factor (ECF subfamily)